MARPTLHEDEDDALGPSGVMPGTRLQRIDRQRNLLGVGQPSQGDVAESARGGLEGLTARHEQIGKRRHVHFIHLHGVLSSSYQYIRRGPCLTKVKWQVVFVPLAA